MFKYLYDLNKVSIPHTITKTPNQAKLTVPVYIFTDEINCQITITKHMALKRGTPVNSRIPSVAMLMTVVHCYFTLPNRTCSQSGAARGQITSHWIFDFWDPGI